MVSLTELSRAYFDSSLPSVAICIAGITLLGDAMMGLESAQVRSEIRVGFVVSEIRIYRRQAWRAG